MCCGLTYGQGGTRLLADLKSPTKKKLLDALKLARTNLAMIIRIISGGLGLLAIGIASLLADHRFRKWESNIDEPALDSPHIGVPLFFFLTGLGSLTLSMMI